MARGKLVIISGPSAGVGKDTVVRNFLTKHPDWKNIPSLVTRPMRVGEVDGQDYHFVDNQTFEQKRLAGEFLETDFHADHWYGTLRQPILDELLKGHNVILRKDVNGSLKIKEQMPETILIYLDAESHDVLESRIRSRSIETSETEQQILSRLELAKQEQKLRHHFDHVVINAHNQHDRTLAEVEKAVGI